MGPTLRWQRAILFPTTPNCSPNKSARGDWLASSSTGYHTGTRFDLWSPSAGRDKRGIHPLGSYSITEKEKKESWSDFSFTNCASDASFCFLLGGKLSPLWSGMLFFYLCLTFNVLFHAQHSHSGLLVDTPVRLVRDKQINVVCSYTVLYVLMWKMKCTP